MNYVIIFFFLEKLVKKLDRPLIFSRKVFHSFGVENMRELSINCFYFSLPIILCALLTLPFPKTLFVSSTDKLFFKCTTQKVIYEPGVGV